MISGFQIQNLSSIFLTFYLELICGLHNKYEVAREVDDYESRNEGNHSPANSDSPLVTRQLATSYRQGLTSKKHIVLSLSYILQQFISLCLMLVFMTFNLYLCLTIVFSAGFGYYIFAWQRVVLSGQLVQNSAPDCH